MYCVNVLDICVGSEEEIEALSLINVGLTVSGMLYKPSLINFHAGLEDFTLLFVQYVGKVLHTTVVGNDAGPDFVVVQLMVCAAFFPNDGIQESVFIEHAS